MFGSSLQQAQQALLPFIPEGARVLLVGGGSGWLLEQLLQSGKTLDVLYLEASPKMLHLARKRYINYPATHSCIVHFKLGTEAALSPPQQFNVVLTPFLLDLFPAQRLHLLMQRLAAVLAPQGLWLFADFWPATQPAPLWQKLLERSMYFFFGVLSGVKARRFPDYGRHFTALGLVQTHSFTFYSGMVQAKVYRRG